MTTDRLREALQRGVRFKTELKRSVLPLRAQLLAAWKELIMDEFVQTLKAVDDPDLLSSLDENIAVAKDIAAGRARPPFSKDA